MKKKKFPKMPLEVAQKLRECRIKGKLGQMSSDEAKFCEQTFTKYGDEQYIAVISDEEVFKLTRPFGSEE